jgi:signal peptidase I
LAIIAMVMIVFHCSFHYSRVVSYSMKPTLNGTNWENGDRILTERVSYWFREPKRWEVVTCKRKDGIEVMKRVVALPGERIQILRGGRIVINGKEVERPPELHFIRYFGVCNVFGGKVYHCSDGYYVLGDHTLDSDDSRYNGTVSRDEIIGRAWYIMGPDHRKGWVNPESIES